MNEICLIHRTFFEILQTICKGESAEASLSQSNDETPSGTTSYQSAFAASFLKAWIFICSWIPSLKNSKLFSCNHDFTNLTRIQLHSRGNCLLLYWTPKFCSRSKGFALYWTDFWFLFFFFFSFWVVINK